MGVMEDTRAGRAKKEPRNAEKPRRRGALGVLSQPPEEKSSVRTSSSYPSIFPFVPSRTSTSPPSARHQFTDDSLVLPVCRAESYTLTRPTCGRTKTF